MTERLSYELWKVELPLSRTVGTPGGPFDRVYAVVVAFRDGDGHEGVAYATMQSSSAMERVAEIMAGLIEERAADLGQLIEIERGAVHAADSHDGRSSVCAISLAAWDLLGHRRGMACADLWSAAPREALDAYASFFFSDLSIDGLIAEGEYYRAQGFRRAKMRAGLPGDKDERRYDALCAVFAEPRSVAVEAFFTFTGNRVEAFMAGRLREPMWIEDPMAYRAIAGVAHKNIVAAGESCTTLADLIALHRCGIARLILDVQYLGGPLRFLEAARTLQAMGAEIGSHIYSHESLHLLAALPASMPVEVFDWWQPIFNEEPRPDGDGKLRVQGPGLGRSLDRACLEHHGVRVTA
jgi:L-alanine-DL-glutamate epimerase-like enolase superfamily enzyme